MRERSPLTRRIARPSAAAFTALLLAALLLAAPPAAAQQAALAPPRALSREMSDGLRRAVAEARQATERYRADRQSPAAQALVDKTVALLDSLGPSAGRLPVVARVQEAAKRAREALATAAPPGPTAGRAAGQRLAEELARLAKADETLLDLVARIFAPTRAIVVSGGVSMGSYQAGFLYYYARALRFYDDQLGAPGAAPHSGAFQIATGASAGSINAFLAAVEGCLEPELEPEKSLFFRAWSGIGLEQLIPKHPKPSADGIFSEDAFSDAAGPIALLERLWTPGKKWPTIPCHTELGISATRLVPRRVNVIGDQIRTTDGGESSTAEAPVLALDRMTEKFLLTMSSAGDGSAPTFAARRTGGNDQIYPTLGQAPEKSGPEGLPATATQVIDLLRASSAFPLAFSPKVVPVTTWYGAGPDAQRNYDEHARFTDGGFLDNTPLRIAQKLSAAIVAKAPAPAADALPAPRPRVLLLMSNAQSWKPSDGQPADGPDQQSVFGRYLPFVFNFLNTTSDGALIDVFEDDTGLSTYDIPMRPFPIAADPLGHFFAFVEPSFRRFDFYQGMVDAEELISGRVAEGKSSVPFQSDAVLECFRAYRRSLRKAHRTVPGLPAECAAVDSHLGPLLLASADRWLSVSAGDDDFEAFTAALKRRGFKYQALAHERTLTPNDVALALRESFDRVGSPLASAQPGFVSELSIAAVAPPVIDLWRYRARTYLGVGLPGAGNFQLVFSEPLHRWRRLALRLEVGGFFGLYPTKTQFMTAAGPKTQLRYPIQPDAGLALEAVLGTGLLGELGLNYAPRTEYFLGDKFPYFAGGQFPYLIQGVEAHLTITFGERIFVSLAPGYLFGGCAGNNGCGAIRDRYASYTPALVAPGLGIDNATLRFSGGWRFLW
jgi:predicted acylesterase/phospholipase RssA